MHFRSQHEESEARRPRLRAVTHTGAFTWGVTCLLLAWVSAIFAFGGTAGETGGLYARMVAVGFVMLALMFFFIRRNPRD